MSRWRHLTVAIGLIPALIIYIGLVMQVADLVTNIHLVLDFAFYFVVFVVYQYYRHLRNILYNNQIYKYDEKEILENKNEFFNSILTKSFFEKKKLIIVSRVSDKIKDIIEEITLKNIIDVTIILSANVLEKKSKLRNFFEKEKNTICIPFYSDTNQTLANITLNFFKQNKISISQHTINLIVERSRGDRENLNNELEKINNY